MTLLVFASQKSQRRTIIMNGQDPVWINDSDDRCTQCEDCPHPNGCIRECVIEAYKHEKLEEAN